MQNRLGARAVPAGLDIALSSTVPSGAGLSSSAAVLCAVACAVDDLLRLGLSEAMLLDITRAAENEFVGAPTGGMDQLASLRGVAGHVLFCDMRAMTSEPVPLDLPAAGLRLLVVDTRAAHRHADGQYRERRSACERAAAALGVPALRDATPTQVQTLSDPLLRRRARHVVTENARVEQTAALLRAGRVRELGPLLDASQLSMADDFEISVAEVDVAVAALRDSGALGARMTGGGFGGCVLALAEDEAVEPTAAAVVAAFARHGFEPPTWAVHTPSAGARRVGD
jgi:galactokinase